MADELDHYRQLLMDDRRETHALAVEARAALAEPEPEEPTNAEIHAIADELLDGDSASRVYFARAVLARWGRPAPQPPSLKEQALKALDSATYQPGTDFKQIDPTRSAILRRALEQLDDD